MTTKHLYVLMSTIVFSPEVN